jgi:hypothetical protein
MFSFIHVFQRLQIQREIELEELVRRNLAASYQNRAKQRQMRIVHVKYK